MDHANYLPQTSQLLEGAISIANSSREGMRVSSILSFLVSAFDADFAALDSNPHGSWLVSGQGSVERSSLPVETRAALEEMLAAVSFRRVHDNVKSLRTLEAAFRPRLYKRYRIYTRGL